MRKSIGSLSFLAIALTAGSAHAADVIYQEPAPAPIVVEPAASAFYIAGRIGAAFPRDTEFGVLGTTVINDYESAGLNGSIAFGGDLGVFGFPLRAEIEGGYTSASVDNHTVVGIGTLGGDAALGSTGRSTVSSTPMSTSGTARSSPMSAAASARRMSISAIMASSFRPASDCLSVPSPRWMIPAPDSPGRLARVFPTT